MSDNAKSNSEPQGVIIDRREAVVGLAALIAHAVLPRASNMLTPLATATVESTPELMKSLPALDFFNRAFFNTPYDYTYEVKHGHTGTPSPQGDINKLSPRHITMQDIESEKVLNIIFQDDDLDYILGSNADNYWEKILNLQASFSERLSLAWSSNVETVTYYLACIERLELVPSQIMSMPATELFSSLKQIIKTSNEQAGKAFHPAQALDNQLLEIFKRYPLLEQAGSLAEIIPLIRTEITEALGLTFQHGCWDLLASQNKLGILKQHLWKARGFFPQDKLYAYDQIVEDIELHGYQTIRMEDLEPKNEWHRYAENLFYRWGLTQLQNGWRSVRVENEMPNTGEVQTGKISYRLGLSPVQNAWVAESNFVLSRQQNPIVPAIHSALRAKLSKTTVYRHNALPPMTS